MSNEVAHNCMIGLALQYGALLPLMNDEGLWELRRNPQFKMPPKCELRTLVPSANDSSTVLGCYQCRTKLSSLFYAAVGDHPLALVCPPCFDNNPDNFKGHTFLRHSAVTANSVNVFSSWLEKAACNEPIKVQGSQTEPMLHAHTHDINLDDVIVALLCAHKQDCNAVKVNNRVIQNHNDFKSLLNSLHSGKCYFTITLDLLINSINNRITSIQDNLEKKKLTAQENVKKKENVNKNKRKVLRKNQRGNEGAEKKQKKKKTMTEVEVDKLRNCLVSLKAVWATILQHDDAGHVVGKDNGEGLLFMIGGAGTGTPDHLDQSGALTFMLKVKLRENVFSEGTSTWAFTRPIISHMAQLIDKIRTHGLWDYFPGFFNDNKDNRTPGGDAETPKVLSPDQLNMLYDRDMLYEQQPGQYMRLHPGWMHSVDNRKGITCKIACEVHKVCETHLAALYHRVFGSRFFGPWSAEDYTSFLVSADEIVANHV